MIILASNSPRRKQLLEDAGFDFTIIPSNFIEGENPGLSPEKYAEFLAENKAKTVLEANADAVVIGADTIVVLNGEILGKPTSPENAVEMLEKLSNKTHSVITGYAIVSKDKTVSGYDITKVTFNNLTKEFIAKYVASGSPMDKAGAYGIQDGDLVKEILGDYNNVVGLPVYKIKKVLAEFI